MTAESKPTSLMGSTGDETDDAALAELYRETVIDHAAEPVGYQLDIGATHRCELYNPLCGDRVEMQFLVNEKTIEAAAFNGEACAICRASASMLCEAIPGHPVQDVGLHHDWLSASLDAKTGKQLAETGLESLRALLAVRRYPARIRCALLPWEAALKALEEFL
jgi:nitrogen fixation NifU-like protein